MATLTEQPPESGDVISVTRQVIEMRRVLLVEEHICFVVTSAFPFLRMATEV